MSTPASIANHPIHPMLVAFPIGLWVFSLIGDMILLSGGSSVWNDIAFYTMAGGLIGALAAAVPGVVDMFSISDARVGKIAWNHMLFNLVAVAIFGVNLYLRATSGPGAAFPIVLSLAGIAFVAVSGWLGGEMVYVHGVAVDRQAAQREDRSEEVRRRAGGSR